MEKPRYSRQCWDRFILYRTCQKLPGRIHPLLCLSMRVYLPIIRDQSWFWQIIPKGIGSIAGSILIAKVLCLPTQVSSPFWPLIWIQLLRFLPFNGQNICLNLCSPNSLCLALVLLSFLGWSPLASLVGVPYPDTSLGLGPHAQTPGSLWFPGQFGLWHRRPSA